MTHVYEMAHEEGEFPFTRPYLPFLAMVDTGELFDEIPKDGPWKLPRPYHDSPDESTRILADGLQIGFQEKWDKNLQDWLAYFGDVEDELNAVFPVRAASYFRRNSGLPLTLDTLASLKRAFSALTSEGSDKPVTEHDIQNARTLVGNFEISIPSWHQFPGCFEEDDE